MDMIKCNKCGKTIPESNRYDESFIEFKRYKTACISKKFHLCADCDAELGKWLANKAQGGEIAIKPELTRKISEVIQRFNSINTVPISQNSLIEAAIIGFLQRMDIRYTDPELAAELKRAADNNAKTTQDLVDGLKASAPNYITELSVDIAPAMKNLDKADKRLTEIQNKYDALLQSFDFDEPQPEPIKYVSELSLDTTPLKNAIEELDQLVREKGDMLNQLTAHGATLTININGGLLTVDGVAAKSSEADR